MNREPIISKKPQLGIRVAPETIELLDRLSTLSHISKTAHVQSALNEYLPRELAKYPQQTG